jgi:hypothetical protein
VLGQDEAGRKTGARSPSAQTILQVTRQKLVSPHPNLPHANSGLGLIVRAHSKLLDPWLVIPRLQVSHKPVSNCRHHGFERIAVNAVARIGDGVEFHVGVQRYDAFS